MSQIISIDDDFADADVATGILGWGLYREIQPWDGNPATSRMLAQTGYNADSATVAAFVTDLVQNGGGQESGSACMHAAVAANNTDVMWHAWSRDVPDETSVRITPRWISGAGFQANQVNCVGVSARMSTGTVTRRGGGDVSTEYVHTSDGYFFLYLRDDVAVASGPTYVLIKVAAGVITQLATAAVPSVSGFSASLNDDTAPRSMRMDVLEDGGGGLAITCYVQHWIGSASYSITGGGGAHSGEELLVITKNISSGGALAAGRCGFGMQGWGTSTGTGFSGFVVDSFEVRDARDLDTIIVRDEFKRVNRYAAFTDGLSDLTGQGSEYAEIASLASAYTGMHHSVNERTYHNGHDERTAATSVTMGHAIPTTGTQVHGYYMQQWPDDDYTAVKRRIKFRLVNDTTNDRRIGLFARATFWPRQGEPREYLYSGAQDRLRTGYRVMIAYVDGGSPVYELQVHHFKHSTSGSYAATLIATADLSAYSLAFNVVLDLEVEVVNLSTDGGGSGSGSAVGIKAAVGLTGVAAGITMVPTTGLGGVSFDDGWLIDIRSEATQSGQTDGFYFNPDATHASGLVRIRSIASMALTDPPTFDEESAASVVIKAETANASGTLTAPIEFALDITHSVRAKAGTFEHPHPTKVVFDHRTRRKFRCRNMSASRAEWGLLRLFYKSHFGTSVPFSWTIPNTSETIVARFTSKLSHRTVGHAGDGQKRYAYGFELEELFDGA